MKILIIAEHDNQVLKSATSHVVSAAAHLGSDIDILIIGSGCKNVAVQAAALTGVKKVLLADHVVYQHQLAENCAQLIAEYGKKYNYILTAATTFGKNVLPRAAALLDVSVLSDVMAVKSALVTSA